MERKFLPKRKDIQRSKVEGRSNLDWFILQYIPRPWDDDYNEEDFRKELIELLNEQQKEIHWEENP
jgi:hypothetical protein